MVDIIEVDNTVDLSLENFLCSNQNFLTLIKDMKKKLSKLSV